MTRDEISRKDPARDRIFMLQTKPKVCRYWTNEMVFHTRQEGEDYARANFPHFVYMEWQVIPVQAIGELCRILRLPETIIETEEKPCQSSQEETRTTTTRPLADS